MTGVQYIIRERESFDKDGAHFRVFKVRRSSENKAKNVDVWHDGTRPFCGGCVGKIHPMSSTCYHSRAVERRVSKERKT